MPRYGYPQTNFQSGILDSKMLARSDVKAYDNGAADLENWWPLVQGGVQPRPGTLFRGDLGEKFFIVDFEFDDSQRYAVCFGEQKLKIIPVLAFASAVDITSGVPWSYADTAEIRWAHYGDIIIVTHPDHPIKVITRTGATSFTIGDFTFEENPSGWPKYRPFYKFQPSGVTLTPSAESGSITLTTSAAYWNASHVGVLIRYKGKQIEITGYTSTTVVNGTVREPLDRGYDLTVNNSNNFLLGETIYGETSGAKGTLVQVPDSTSLYVDMQTGGTFSPTEAVRGLTSNVTASCTGMAVINPLATYDWEEELFSDYRGWPSAVGLHQQRLCFGGSTKAPLALALSQTGAIYNFDAGEGLDAEAIAYQLTSPNGGRIRAFVSGVHLQIFTDQGEYYAPESNELPLTPGTFSIRQVAHFGCSDAIPIGFDNTTLFVQKGGKVVRELLWNEIEQTYDAPAVSLPSTEFLKNIQATTALYSFEDQPETVSFFLNEDGTVAVFHSTKSEGIMGWHYWTTTGSVVSIQAIGEQLFAVVERTVNSVVEYFFEEFTFDTLLDASEFVENGSVGSTFSGFDHLASQEVDVTLSYDDSGTWRDNAYYLETFTVSAGGVIDISVPNNYEGKRICAGFKFDSAITPMPVEKMFQDGAKIGEIKTIVSTSLILKDSVSVQADGYKLIARNVTDDLSNPPALITDIREFYLLGWGKLMQPQFERNVPLPCTVLGLFHKVEF